MRRAALVVLAALGCGTSGPSYESRLRSLTVYPFAGGVIVRDGCDPIDPTAPSPDPTLTLELRLWRDDELLDVRAVSRTRGTVEERWYGLDESRVHRVELWGVRDGVAWRAARSTFQPKRGPEVVTLLANVGYPAVSPDGTRIALIDRNDWHLVIATTEGVVLRDLDFVWAQPYWSSPTTVAVSEYDGTDTVIRSIDVETGASEVAARVPARRAELFAATSAGYDLLDVATREWLHVEADTVQVVGTFFTTRRHDPLPMCPTCPMLPARSPDGSRVAVVASGGSVLLYDASASLVGRLEHTDKVAHWASPAWSPDGSQLAVAVARGTCQGPDAGAWTIEVATNRWTQRTGYLGQSRTAVFAGLAWMHDGRLAFSDGGLNVVATSD